MSKGKFTGKNACATVFALPVSCERPNVPLPFRAVFTALKSCGTAGAWQSRRLWRGSNKEKILNNDFRFEPEFKICLIFAPSFRDCFGASLLAMTFLSDTHRQECLCYCFCEDTGETPALPTFYERIFLSSTIIIDFCFSKGMKNLVEIIGRQENLK